jgi:FlaA1/EpsC-like NDP-sugar epimerase
MMLTAMIAVGVYGADSLRSMRFACARLLVAVSLAIIALSFVDFVFAGHNFWRSTLAYGMALAIVLLVVNRLVVGGILGTSAFRRRVLVLGAGSRAERLRELVSRRSDCDGLIQSENGQFLRRDEQLNAASDAWLLIDQSDLVEGLEHLVN